MTPVEYRFDLSQSLASNFVEVRHASGSDSPEFEAALAEYEEARKAAPKLRKSGRMSVALATGSVIIGGDVYSADVTCVDGEEVVLVELRLASKIKPADLQARVQALRAQGWTDQ